MFRVEWVNFLKRAKAIFNLRRIESVVTSVYNAQYWYWRYLIELTKIRIYLKFKLANIGRRTVCVVYSPSNDRPDLGTLLGCILLVRMLQNLGYVTHIVLNKREHSHYVDFWQSAHLLIEEYCGQGTTAERVLPIHFQILGNFLPVQILPRLLGKVYRDSLYGKNDFLIPKILEGATETRKESRIAIAVRGDVIAETRNTPLGVLIERLHEIPDSFENRKYVVYGHQKKAEECAKMINEHLRNCSCKRFGDMIELDATTSIYNRIKSFLRAEFILSVNNHGLADLAMFSQIPYYIESPRYRFAEYDDTRLYPWQMNSQKWKYNSKLLEK